jgi:hypothetical protein
MCGEFSKDTDVPCGMNLCCSATGWCGVSDLYHMLPFAYWTRGHLRRNTDTISRQLKSTARTPIPYTIPYHVNLAMEDARYTKRQNVHQVRIAPKVAKSDVSS